jgi:2-amino-4-hydroxy-6-hydroxymethyldihydropteridine diphosphokinase
MSHARLTEAAIGLGANLGDRPQTIREALERLDDGEDVRVTAVSSLYETAPWGDLDQPPFLNACALVTTRLTARELLARCLAIESQLGRDREKSRRWGPRPIDLDVLFWGDATIDEPGLTLPHPRMLERAFVMIPLAEIAPDRIVGGRRIADVAAASDHEGVERWPGAD